MQYPDHLAQMIDVLVIGAGPAGSSFAYNLKKLNPGAHVVLLDKAEFPRAKTCGGGVSKDIHRYLDFTLDPVVSCEMNTVAFTINGETTIYDLPTSLYMVRREQFDDYLLKKAREVGVHFKARTAVSNLEFITSEAYWRIFIENQAPLFAKIVILAEGGAGHLAKKLGINLKCTVCAGLEYEHPLPHDAPIVAMNFDNEICGYSWNFPKQDGQSLGIAGKIKGSDKGNTSLKQMLQHYVQNFSINTLEKKYLSGHPIKLYSGKKKLCYNQLLLIGECAGCVDPLTAEGIRPAVKSGFIAAEIVNRALATHNLKILREYNQAFQQHIGRDFQYARFCSMLAYCFKYKVMPRNKNAILLFWRIFCGECTYREVFHFKRIFRLLRRALL